MSESFADRLEGLRREHDLTVKETCELITVPYQTYRNWMHRNTFPRPDTIKKIAEAFSVTTAYLMTGTTDTESQNPEPVEEKPNEESAVVNEPKPADIPKMASVSYPIYHRSIKYNRVDSQKLQDINSVINQIKYMNITQDKKKRIHRLLSEYRMELECKVFYGDDDL